MSESKPTLSLEELRDRIDQLDNEILEKLNAELPDLEITDMKVISGAPERREEHEPSHNVPEDYQAGRREAVAEVVPEPAVDPRDGTGRVAPDARGL